MLIVLKKTLTLLKPTQDFYKNGIPTAEITFLLFAARVVEWLFKNAQGCLYIPVEGQGF